MMARFPDPVARQHWQKRLRRFEQSRLTVAAFCQTERVSVTSFYYWRNAPRPNTSSRPAVTPQNSAAIAKPVFLPVQVVGKPIATGALDVQLPNGVRLALPGDNRIPT